LKPLILVSNDDGVEAVGLERLAGSVAGLGEVRIVAPSRNHSGASHSLTLRDPLRVRQIAPDRFSVDGTPTDCVNLGFFRLSDRYPDLVLSGINAGWNLGDDVTYSGTVSAALEGALLGRPAIAFSRERSADTHWDEVTRFIRSLAARVLRDGLPTDTLLNVNFPGGAPKGVRATRQGRRVNEIVRAEPVPPAGGEWFTIAEPVPDWRDDPDADVFAVRAGYISVTPLHPDLTRHEAVSTVASWHLGLE